MAYLKLKTCRAVEAYLLEKTGKKVSVTRTDTKLVVSYAEAGELVTAKLPLPGGVLYCLEDVHLEVLIQTIGASTTT